MQFEAERFSFGPCFMSEFIDFHLNLAPKRWGPVLIDSEENSLIQGAGTSEVLSFNQIESGFGSSPRQTFLRKTDDRVKTKSLVGEKQISMKRVVVTRKSSGGDNTEEGFADYNKGEDEGIPESPDRTSNPTKRLDFLRNIKKKLDEDNKLVEEEITKNKMEKMINKSKNTYSKNKKWKVKLKDKRRDSSLWTTSNSPNTLFGSSSSQFPKFDFKEIPESQRVLQPSKVNEESPRLSKRNQIYPEDSDKISEENTSPEKEKTRAQLLWKVAQKVFEDKIRYKK